MVNLGKSLKGNFWILLTLTKVGVFFVLFSFSFYFVFAAPPTSPYDPGETLAPSCSPGNTNCTVRAPVVSLNGSTSSTQIFVTSTSGQTFTMSTANGVHTINFPSRIQDINALATTTGNLIVGSGATWITKTVGSNGLCLVASSSATGGMAWGSCLGSGGITSLNGLTNASQTFATGTDTNIQLTVSSTGSIHTFTPVWNGVLGVSRGGTGTSTPFTTGSLVFAGAGGIYSENNSNLFWDNTNARLGIGNSSPSSTLHVTGSTTITNALDVASGTLFVDAVNGMVGVGTKSTGNAKLEVAGSNVRISSTGNAVYEFYQSGADRGFVGWRASGMPAGVYLWNKDNSPIYLGTNDTERIRITWDGLVGIGTTTPSYRLDVWNGSINTASSVCIAGDCRSSWAAVASSSGWTKSGTNVYLSTLTDSVGIGTTSPAYKLDVAGTFRATATSTFDGRVGVGTTTPNVALEIAGGVRVNNIASGISSLVLGNAADNLGITGDGLQLAYEPGSSRTVFRSVNWSVGYKDIEFYGRDMKFNSGDGSIVATSIIDRNGNVGIGTTTPSYKLDVWNGSINTASSVCIAGDCRSSWVAVASSSGWTKSGTNVYLSTLTDSVGIGNTSPSTTLHVTGSSTFIGRVGIGTSTPSSKLVIAGGGAGEKSLIITGNTSNNANIQEWQNNAGTLKSFVTSDGRLMINRTSDAGASTAIGVDGVAATGGIGLLFNTGQADARGITIRGKSGQTADLQQWQDVNGTSLSVVDANGRFGIGTASPSSSLHIASSSQAILSLHNTGSGGRQFDLRSGSVAAGAFDIYDSASGTSRIVIDGAGNIGIGTTTPQRALHVVTGTDGPPVRFQDASGYCEIDPILAAWSCTSDVSLKKDVVTMPGAVSLSRLVRLNPVNFRWKNQKDDTLRYGFVAQEVEQVFPEFVNTDENGIKTVAFGALTPVMISAIQEQQHKIEELRQMIADDKKASKAEVALDGQRLESLIVSGALVAEEVRTQRLCVGETCITEADLKAVLKKVQVEKGEEKEQVAPPANPRPQEPQPQESQKPQIPVRTDTGPGGEEPQEAPTSTNSSSSPEVSLSPTQPVEGLKSEENSTSSESEAKLSNDDDAEDKVEPQNSTSSGSEAGNQKEVQQDDSVNKSQSQNENATSSEEQVVVEMQTNDSVLGN